MTTTDAIRAIQDRIEYNLRANALELERGDREPEYLRAKEEAYLEDLEIIKDIGGLIK